MQGLRNFGGEAANAAGQSGVIPLDPVIRQAKLTGEEGGLVKGGARACTWSKCPIIVYCFIRSTSMESDDLAQTATVCLRPNSITHWANVVRSSLLSAPLPQTQSTRAHFPFPSALLDHRLRLAQ